MGRFVYNNLLRPFYWSINDSYRTIWFVLGGTTLEVINVLMEDDIKLLIEMEHWVSVIPHNKKWKCVIWRLDGEAWKPHKNKIHLDPIKCYEWAADIIEEVHNKYQNT
jgi:hypothetical protein|tara:strand:+ start:1880 stop:2203 length:324 start_codon:yes stop_codon:yes gene_type:complete